MPNFNNYYDDYYNPIDFGGATGVMAGIPNEARKDLFDFGSVPYQAMAASWTDLFSKRQENEKRQKILDEQNDFANLYQQNPTISMDDPSIAAIYGKYGDIGALQNLDERKRQASDKDLQTLGRVLDIGRVNQPLANSIYDLNNFEQKYGPLDSQSLGNQVVSVGDGGFAVVNPQTGATRNILEPRADAKSDRHIVRYRYNDKGEKAVIEGFSPTEYGNAEAIAIDQGYIYSSPAQLPENKAAEKARQMDALIRGASGESPKEASDFESQSDPALLERLAQTFGYQQPTQKIVQVRKKLKVN